MGLEGEAAGQHRLSRRHQVTVGHAGANGIPATTATPLSNPPPAAGSLSLVLPPEMLGNLRRGREVTPFNNHWRQKLPQVRLDSEAEEKKRRRRRKSSVHVCRREAAIWCSGGFSPVISDKPPVEDRSVRGGEG